ncbi:CHAT domain-containing protein [Archangium gephyra]|uniref:CHAT domain-containing protein n=1 Tax=Archangium gephyra TaxID=48 RepID=A0AAC8Q6M2_9BACT|nr:CHAT domain-containing protein [Archangium gephyra]AKJ01749.1 TPR repeat protein [Archangium gephyra]REG34559.1 CHAT domain-containing protein [Archangium gephyra]
MALRKGGFEPKDLEDGFHALLQAPNPKRLEALIGELPVLRAPVFHEEVSRTLAGELPPQVRHRLETFFLLLDKGAHQLRARSLLENGGGRRASVPPPHAPPYFQRLMELLGTHLPPGRIDAPLDPSTDGARIEADVAALTGAPAGLPSYAPTPGSQWGIVLVECMGCGARRAEVRALRIDLTRAPELKEPLEQGRINGRVCPRCRFEMGLPAGIWILERPWPGDILATLACIVRVDAQLSVYLPSSSRERDFSMLRVLEARSRQLLHELEARDAPPEEEPGMQMVAIAYGQDELRTRLRDTPEERQLPALMEGAWAQLALGLESGQMTLEEAQVYARELAGREGRKWPVLLSSVPLDEDGRPLRAVAFAVLTEQLAEQQGLEPLECARFSVQTASALLEAQRPAQAEAALVRAEDWLKRAPEEGEPQRALVVSMVEGCRSDLLIRQGRYEEAAEHRRRSQEALALQRDGSWPHRFDYWRFEAIEALHLRRLGKPDESLAAFSRCIPMLEQLHAEALQHTPPLGRELIAYTRKILSGALANCASVLQEGQAYFSATARNGRSSGLDWVLDYAERLPAWQGEPREPVDEDARRQIAVGRLLTQALTHSRDVQDWVYATAQTGRLKNVMVYFKLRERAEAVTSDWLEVATRASDFDAAAEARFLLGRMAIHRKEGPRALDHFEEAAKFMLRHLVSLGHEGSELLEWAPALVELSFLAVLAGADASRAIMIAESLKAARTAMDVAAGPPEEGARGQQSLLTRLEALSETRERLRLYSFRYAETAPETTRILARLQQLERELGEVRQALAIRGEKYLRWSETANIQLSTAEGMRRRLGELSPRATYLGLSTGHLGIWCHALWKDGCEVALVAWPELPDDMKALENPAELALSRDPEALRGVLARVAELVQAPLQERLELLTPEDHLVISPSREFLGVPFAAVPVAGKLLAERVVISYVQGAGLFEACFDRPRSAVRSALLVGVHEHACYEPLPHARREVLQLERLFQKASRETHSLLEKDATVPAVLAKASAHDVLHFSCHARWWQEGNDRPHLVLSPESGRDSGTLTDWRIMEELKLRPGALINLAACESGRQTGSGTEIRDGLVPAMLLAGAGAVVATLWPIWDAHTPAFQARFYQHLLAGQRPADALTSVLRACIRGELGEALAAPAHWAAFTLHGAG